MSRQGSVRIATLIETERRIAAIDRTIDQLDLERRALVDRRNECDFAFWIGHRSLGSPPEPIDKRDFHAAAEG